MPIDLSVISDALRRGFAEVPPIAIALGLLAGPTVALIGYRLIGVARRARVSPEVEAPPLWVCHDCRSVNEFRQSNCYRCGTERAAGGEIEVFVDAPVTRPTTFEAPLGSPFAAVGGGAGSQGQGQGPGQGPGVPVMADASAAAAPVAVGPGRAAESATTDLPTDELTSAVERRP